MIFLARIRLVVFIMMLLLGIAAFGPAIAQKLNPDGAPNPTASVTSEQDLFKQVPRIEGRIDIPDKKASVLIQPAGRTWDYFHEVLLHWGGAIVILGTIVFLGFAYLIIGRIRITEGRSGKKILRFKAFERFSHWLTAVSFVVLGLTGLNITFGKILLLPVVGPDTFSDISQVAKNIHNFTSFSFVVGLVLITLIFFRDNIFGKVDLEWLRQGGGFIKNKHAPAGRFNLGEKLVYWLSVAAGVAVSISGLLAAVSFLRNRDRRHAAHTGRACRRGCPVRRPDPGPHLYRHTRHGGRVRSHGHRRSRSQLGQGAPRSLACSATRQPRPARTAFGDTSGINCSTVLGPIRRTSERKQSSAVGGATIHPTPNCPRSSLRKFATPRYLRE